MSIASTSRADELLETVLGVSTKAQVTGIGNISTTLNPGIAFTLREVRLHLSAAGGANNFTITIDNGSGSTFDTVIFSQDMTSVTDIFWKPDMPIELKDTDKLIFAWTNGSGRTYGLEVLYTAI